MRHVLLAAAALLAAPGGARAESLAALLAAVATNARFERPVRADVRIECGAGCAAAGKRAILVGRSDRLYVEVEDGLQALVAPDGIRLGPAAAPAKSGASLAGSDVALEDLVVFGERALTFPQISDDAPTGVVVTGAPAGLSAYALLVHTIDRDRRAVVRTQYYEGSIGNLTKIRRDAELTEVAGHWRPGEIRVDTLRTGTSTRLRLKWRDAPDAPATLFEPDALTRPSGLRFP